MRQTEAKREAYEHRYGFLEEHIREAVVAATLDFTIVYCSPTIENLSGRTPDELVGTNLLRLFSLPSLNTVRVVPEKVRGASKEKILTLELRQSDGGLLPVITRLFVNPNRDPEIVMVLRLEDDLDDGVLYETTEKCRLVFETTKEAMFVVNIHGRIIDVNTAWVDAFLYSRDEVTGLKLHTFFPKELQDLLVYNARRSVISWEGVVSKKDGMSRSCRVQAVLWKGKDGEALGHVARIWNINRQE